MKRNPVGRIKRSYFGAFRVNDGPTNVTFVTMRFHSFSAHVKRRKIRRRQHSAWNKIRILDAKRSYAALLFRLPVLMTLNISSSVIGATLGRGTLHLPAFCFRFSLIVLLSTWQQRGQLLSTSLPLQCDPAYSVRSALTFARFTSPRSSRYGGIEPSVCLDSSGADAFFSLWAFRLWQDGTKRSQSEHAPCVR